MSVALRGLSIDRLSTRERAVVIAGAVFVLLALAHAYAISPFLAAAANRREVVQAEREAVARQLALIQGASTTASQLETASAVLDAIKPRLFSSPAEEGGTVAALAAIEAHVERLAVNAGARPDRISATPDSTAGADSVVMRVDVTIAASAGISGLADFLAHLEDGEKLIRVSCIRLLGPSMEHGPAALMSFELELNAYVLMSQVSDAASARS